MKVEEGKRIRLKVKLQVVDGDVIEESVAEYFHGSGTMLPGLESELEGLAEGSVKKGVIPADHAFGHPQSQAEKSIARAEFPAEANLEPGHQFAAKAENGQDVILRVVSADDDKVVVKLVHPLAEKDISFEAEILGISDPTPPPLPAEAIAEETE